MSINFNFDQLCEEFPKLSIYPNLATRFIKTSFADAHVSFLVDIVDIYDVHGRKLFSSEVIN